MKSEGNKFVAMKNTLIIISTIALFLSFSGYAQEQKTRNRYGMPLYEKKDGSYKVSKPMMEILGDDIPDDLLVPCKIGPAIPAKFTTEAETIEVVYKSYPDHDLKLFIHKSAITKKPTPVMFFIHGGGWYGGRPESMLPQAKYVAQNSGMAGVSIQYSLCGQKGIDIAAAVQDCRDAVQFIRDHAAEYNIDPGRMGFSGSSAGGHLAAVLAMTEPEAKVLVGWVGAYMPDRMLEYWPGADKHNLREYFYNGDQEKLAPYLPVKLVPTDRQIPCILFFGSGDNVVLQDQPRTFAAALEEAGQTVQLEYYPYYTHGFARFSDKNAEVWKKSVRFIKTYIFKK